MSFWRSHVRPAQALVPLSAQEEEKLLRTLLQKVAAQASKVSLGCVRPPRACMCMCIEAISRRPNLPCSPDFITQHDVEGSKAAADEASAKLEVSLSSGRGLGSLASQDLTCCAQRDTVGLIPHPPHTPVADHRWWQAVCR